MRPSQSENIFNGHWHLFRQTSDSKLVQLIQELQGNLRMNERRMPMTLATDGKIVVPTTLLFVDDNITLVEFATRYMGEIRPEWRFLLAHSLAEARLIYNRYSPDAAVLDVGLPDGNGLDLLSEFKRQRPGFPVIMISGDDQEALRQTVIARGAYSFLSKPFSAPDLMNHIELAISSSRGVSPVPVFPQPEASGAWRNPYALVLRPTNQKLAIYDPGAARSNWFPLK